MPNVKDLVELWTLIALLLVNLGVDPQMLGCPEDLFRLLMSGPLASLFQPQMPSPVSVSTPQADAGLEQAVPMRVPRSALTQVPSLTGDHQISRHDFPILGGTPLPSTSATSLAGRVGGMSEAEALEAAYGTGWRSGSRRTSSVRTAGSGSAYATRWVPASHPGSPVGPLLLGLGALGGMVYAGRKLAGRRS